MSQKKLFQIKNLKTYFHTEAGVAKAVNDVSFDIYQGEVLGIVGESGSGKSVTSMSINRLIPNPPGEIVGGEVEIFSVENHHIAVGDFPKRPCVDFLYILNPRQLAAHGRNVFEVVVTDFIDTQDLHCVGLQLFSEFLVHFVEEVKLTPAKASRRMAKVPA